MIFSWLKRRRRRKLLEQPFPEQWREHLGRVRLYSELDEQERTTLENDLRVIVSEKHWEPCGGITLTEEMKVVIAAQAALLLLGLEHDYYCGVQSILVYPTTFLVPGQRGPGGFVREGKRATLGLASLQGPVVLAWDSVLRGSENAEDGRNVVLHEFAHKLDMLDRFADGAPPLRNREQYRAWERIMKDEYQALIESDRRGRSTLLDRYGATHPAEFFAVATEHFFEKPVQMKKKHEELYGLLCGYYRQDPATRAGRPGTTAT